MVDYGKALRQARAIKELKQEVLADAAGISSNYISMIEQGKRKPSVDVLEQLATALSVPVWVLVVLGSTDVPDGVRSAAMAELTK
jgi:transcriptional regulator with XRE-family HTH domain